MIDLTNKTDSYLACPILQLQGQGFSDSKAISTERWPAGGSNRYTFQQYFPKLFCLPSRGLFALQPYFLLL